MPSAFILKKMKTIQSIEKGSGETNSSLTIIYKDSNLL